jgi:hypothetical protein
MRLAGELAYEPPPKPVAWRQIVLWSVLVLTVGTVLWLSVRLLGGAGNQGPGHEGAGNQEAAEAANSDPGPDRSDS